MAEFNGSPGRRGRSLSSHAVSSLPIELLDAPPPQKKPACRAAEVKAKHNLYYADSFEQGLDVHK